jgi:hypothetical protein
MGGLLADDLDRSIEIAAGNVGRRGTDLGEG